MNGKEWETHEAESEMETAMAMERWGRRAAAVEAGMYI